MFISPPNGETSPKEQFPSPSVYLRKLLIALLIIAACLVVRYVNSSLKNSESAQIEANVEVADPQ